MIRPLYCFIGYLFLSLLILSSCEDDGDDSASVFTEDVFFVGSDKVRVLGRVIATTSVEISDHGFEVSTSESFSNARVVSLGDKVGPGRFITEISGLSIGQEYFIRSFIISDKGQVLGNVIRLNTLIPQLFDFSPKIGLSGESMQISGINFTDDTKVFFGSVEAQIANISFESIITLSIPPIGNNITPSLRIVSQGQEIVSAQPFEYIVGKFVNIGQFPGNSRIFQNIGFLSGNEFIVGLGANESSVPVSKFWKYNINTNQWTEFEFPGRTHYGAFSANGYIGGGTLNGARFDLLNPSNINRDFWYYNGTQFVSRGQLPFVAYKAVGFIISGYLYVVGGEDPNLEKQFYRYNLSTNIWEKLPNAAYSIDNSMATFTYGVKQYFVDKLQNLLEYDPNGHQWKIVGKFPSSNAQGGGFAQVIGNKAIIGLYKRTNEIWELDMNTFTWKTKTRFVGDIFSSNVGSYVKDNMVYILRAKDIGNPNPTPMEWIRFDPIGF